MTSAVLATAPRAAARTGLAPAWVAVSVLIAALVLTTSLLGLLAPWPYAAETDDWRLQAHGQDLGNLLAVGTLLAGLVPAARGSLRGRMVWAGSLLYLGYAFVIYALAIHFGPLFLPYVAVLGLSVYALAFGLRPWRGDVRVERRPRVFGSVVIASIAVLFGLLWLAAIIPALIAGAVPAELARSGLVANPVHVLDLALVLPAMLVTAGLAGRGSGAGLTLLGPLLVFSVLMAASVTIALVLGGAVPPAVILGLITVVSVVAATRVLWATSPAASVPLPEHGSFTLN
jgi:hypothetical protein